MTKHINDWKIRLSLYLQKRREKEIKTDIQNSKDSIIHLYTNNKDTHQTLEMVKDIEEQINNLMRKRLEKVSEEKSVLESFLREKTKK